MTLTLRTGNPSAFQFRDLLTMAELAAYLHKSGGEAARKWARRHGVPMTKCGAQWRVDRRDVDLVMQKATVAANLRKYASAR